MNNKRKNTSSATADSTAACSDDDVVTQISAAERRAQLLRELTELDRKEALDACCRQRMQAGVTPAPPYTTTPPYSTMAAAIAAEFTNERIEVNVALDDLMHGETPGYRVGTAFTYTFDDSRGRKYAYVLHVGNSSGPHNRLVLNYTDAATSDRCAQRMAASRFAATTGSMLGDMDKHDPEFRPLLPQYLPLPDAVISQFHPYIGEYAGQRRAQLWEAFQFLLFERALDLALLYLAIMEDELPYDEKKTFNFLRMHYPTSVAHALSIRCAMCHCAQGCADRCPKK